MTGRSTDAENYKMQRTRATQPAQNTGPTWDGRGVLVAREKAAQTLWGLPTWAPARPLTGTTALPLLWAPSLSGPRLTAKAPGLRVRPRLFSRLCWALEQGVHAELCRSAQGHAAGMLGRGLKALSEHTAPQMGEDEVQHQTEAVTAHSAHVWNSLWWLKSTFPTKETCREHDPLPVYNLLARNIRLESRNN